MGIGFCLVVDPAAADEILTNLAMHSATIIGEVGDGEGVTLG
jgi:phosphoribosylaminoimidazole (AIR) synthetase